MIGVHIVAGERAPLFDGIDRNVNWDGAACIGEDPELWFAEQYDGDPYDEARAICERCPIRKKCLEFAMEREGCRTYRAGMFGGLTPAERYQLSKERRAER